MDREEVTKWLKIMKANLNSFPEVSSEKKIEALAEAIRLLKNEQSIDKIDCDHIDCNNCVNHKYCDYESNKSEIPTGSITDVPENNVGKIEPTKNDLGVDCISREDALRVAKNEYLRGWHNALCKALSEKYSIHCEEGNFSVIQEETITGLGLSMNCALGKDVESYMSTMPSVTQIRPKGHWIYDKSFANWICSKCGETPKTIGYVGTGAFMAEHFKYCNHCGAEMDGVEEK